MVYVMSDLHGEYEKYSKMLQLINFSDEDILYINGDICDRGKDSAKIYLDILCRNNVFAIKGNHEIMVERYLDKLLMYSEDGESDNETEINMLVAELLEKRDFLLWIKNGGAETLRSLFEQSLEDRNKIAEFIKALPYYRKVDVGSKHYIMVHAGFGDYQKGMKIEDIDKDEMVWPQPDFNTHYFEEEKDTYVVVGHTPTFMLREPDEIPTVYYGKGNIINVDCGAVYSEYFGRLACLCLDTGEEYYV